MIKTTKFIKRCPVRRSSFEAIKSCLVSVEKNDGSTQIIRTHTSFLQLDKNEKLDTKVSLLAQAVSGLIGVKSYSYQVS